MVSMEASAEGARMCLVSSGELSAADAEYGTFSITDASWVNSMNDPSAVMILHIPGVQPDFACAELPACTRFLSPGLPGTLAAPYWCAPSLPFSPPQARACLNEMVALGEQFRSTRDLVTLALQPEDSKRHAESALRHEMAELDAFAATGEVGHGQPSPKGPSAEQVQIESAMVAQKTLILAWNLEGRVHELQQLQDSFSGVAQSFRTVVGVDEDDLSELPGMSNVVAELAESAAETAHLSWHTAVDAVLCLAPADAAFITCDQRVVSMARELGVVTDPDADLAALCTEEEAKGIAGMCRIAAWTLLGHSRVPAARPWLNREVRILFCTCAEA